MELLFRLKRNFFRLKIKLSTDSRPSSYPYISGDGFRKMADHLYDETTKCQAKDIRAKQIVFVKSDLIDEYFKELHPLIKFPYKLITHNSDRNITQKDLPYIDEKIIHWYGQNVLVSHPKLTPIPIGLENLHIYLHGITKFFNSGRNQRKIEKKNRILFGFNPQTNSFERQPAREVLNKSSVTDEVNPPLNPEKYLARLNNYAFVASPPGNGLDCHRTWEALYLKTVPIVKRSVATEYFYHLGLPVWIIDDWQEIDNLTEETLGDIYLKLTKQSNQKPLFLDYWSELLNKNE